MHDILGGELGLIDPSWYWMLEEARIFKSNDNDDHRRFTSTQSIIENIL
jgi:hypothetical protein